MRLVLDSEAMSSLSAETGDRYRHVAAAMRAAHRLNRDVVVPAVVLAELYRGPGRNQVVDACLSRQEDALDVRETDRPFARMVGGVLHAAGAGSEDLADAHVVAAAVESGGGVILTGDEGDLNRLGGSYPNLQVVPI